MSRIDVESNKELISSFAYAGGIFQGKLEQLRENQELVGSLVKAGFSEIDLENLNKKMQNLRIAIHKSS